jgi:hypothetical protein
MHGTAFAFYVVESFLCSTLCQDCRSAGRWSWWSPVETMVHAAHAHQGRACLIPVRGTLGSRGPSDSAGSVRRVRLVVVEQRMDSWGRGLRDGVRGLGVAAGARELNLVVWDKLGEVPTVARRG